jgi:NAD(P)-dependent dehydrogenase (short-subunit alcohol dehydrogenase family)
MLPEEEPMIADWSERDIPRLDGQKAIVTGANSGIGFHTALELGRAGAEVTLAVRDTARGEEAKKQMLAEAPGARITVEALDLASLASVRAFADKQLAQKRPLDLLVNNAGVMALPERTLTVDGYEAQFATNHLGHFALTGQLWPLISQARAPRVVTVSSSVTMWAKLELDNLQSERRYAPMRTYGQSKLANLLFMLELRRRGEPLGLISVASHPGATITNLQKYQYTWIIKVIGQSAARGALPSLYAATAADVRGGQYFGPRDRLGMAGPPAQAKLPRRALDAALAEQLWQKSEELTGVRFAFGDHAGARAS